MIQCHSLQSAHTNRTWEIHASILIPESDRFAQIHRFGTGEPHDANEDPCIGVRSLARLGPQRYQLIEVTDACFKDFLRGVKPRYALESYDSLSRAKVSRNSLCQDNSQTRFRNILILATDWGFEGLRTIAIRNITAHMLSPRTSFTTRLGDLDFFLLAHRTRVSSWLPISHTYFVTKIALLSTEAISAIGPRVTAAINQARAMVRKQRLALVAPDTPPEWVSGWFRHTDCWQALGDCWKRVLNDADAVRPRVALLEELTAQRGSTTTTRKFCDGCFEKAKNGMLNDWLQLKKDEKIAEEVLIAVLGDDLDAWLDL